jgi:hypothetical protein
VFEVSGQVQILYRPYLLSIKRLINKLIQLVHHKALADIISIVKQAARAEEPIDLHGDGASRQSDRICDGG